MDDKYIMGETKEDFQAFDKYKAELGLLELSVNASKSIALFVPTESNTSALSVFLDK